MTSCAATTTIRRIVDDLTNPYWERLPGDNPEADALSALASLEQLVEAADYALDALRSPEYPVKDGGDVYSPEMMSKAANGLSAALAAVGPGEEPAQ